MAHLSHIPQPPHSAGLSYKGLRAAIDPRQIPSIVDTIDTDRQLWEERQTYPTLPGKHAPLSTSDYIAVDQGNSSPKFIRFSTWNIPSTSRLASDCNVPIVASIQPFAELDPREEPIPLVETGDIGPARCSSCRGYINPWCTWVSGGSRWKCNLCGHENLVHPDYFCNLDANFMRLDQLQRPELTKGTVDFVVSEEYWANNMPPKLTSSYISVNPSPTPKTRSPKPLHYVFAFDVSADSVESGFLKSSCDAVIALLFEENPEGVVLPCFAPECKMSIITFDRSLHFYNLSPQLEDAHMLVVADLDEVFVPLRSGLFVDALKSRTVIQRLLEALPQRHAETTIRQSALGSALSACLASLAGRGGQVTVFQAIAPTIGLGALDPADSETQYHGTEKEKLLYAPREPFWRTLAEECAEEGVGISMFLGMSRFIDIGSIGHVASVTGGEVFYHPRFIPQRDGPVLNSQLRRLVTRTTGYNCMMRVRCSKGLRVSDHYGNFHKRSATELEFGTIDADKAIVVRLKHTATLDERQYAYIQSAVLYTSSTGQRRVRMCNMALQVVELAGNVFRFADSDATVAYLVRKSISQLSSHVLANVRGDLSDNCGATLLGYRRQCAAASAPSQLIIPEAYRGLPVYTLAITKSKALKEGFVSADVRNYYAHRINSMSVRSVVQHLYPPLMSLHDLDDTIALPDPATGRIHLPSLMRNSHIFMEAHGIYLIDNEEVMMLWVGGSASPQLLLDLFGVDDISQVDPRMTQLPQLSSLLSTQVQNILSYRQAQRGRVLKFVMVRQNMDGSEIEFSDMLMEDQNNSALSYLDYLCLIHKNIAMALKSGAVIHETGSVRSPW